jgi:cobaltochelatase CobN
MHLKLDSRGSIDDGDMARDLGQATADIVILSAADSDLAAFGAAHASLGSGFPSVRLTNLLALGHPASVDLYVERTLRDAKIVVLRMLGGESYWPHGVDSLRSDALRRGALFACIPGEMDWNAGLAARGTLGPEETHALWRYCSEGGVDNAQLALRYAAHLIGRDELPPPARPMPSAGFWRGEGASDGRPNVIVVFYRALVAGGDTAAIDALRDALGVRGLNAVCIFVTSLKDERSAAFLRAALAAHPPDIIVNATAFATATATDDAGVLSASGCPVLQVAQAGVSRESWEKSSRGLSPRDLAMHVVLPEVDGRIFAHAIAFKERTEAGEGFAPTTFRPVEDRIAATVDLATAWIRLRRTPKAERRVAMVLANYPSRDGRLANGVGLDTPQSLIEVLGAMQGAGYIVSEAPDNPADMIQLLQDGPTNVLDGRAQKTGGVAWPVKSYEEAFAMLPAIRMSPRAASASACIVLATRSSACSRRAATTSIPRAAITIPIWYRRIITSPSICGSGAISIPTRSCISANTAISNGCRARAPACRRIACPTRCWGSCRISIPLSSTIPARAFRPSGGRPPSSSTT